MLLRVILQAITLPLAPLTTVPLVASVLVLPVTQSPDSVKPAELAKFRAVLLDTESVAVMTSHGFVRLKTVLVGFPALASVSLLVFTAPVPVTVPLDLSVMLPPAAHRPVSVKPPACLKFTHFTAVPQVR